jgi:hypothetical protein
MFESTSGFHRSVGSSLVGSVDAFVQWEPEAHTCCSSLPIRLVSDIVSYESTTVGPSRRKSTTAKRIINGYRDSICCIRPLQLAGSTMFIRVLYPAPIYRDVQFLFNEKLLTALS